MDSDGFVLIDKNHKRRAKRKNIPGVKQHRTGETFDVSINEQDITSKMVELHQKNYSSFLADFIATDAEGKFDFVCYGLGNFGRCYRAQYQLAFMKTFLKLLRDVDRLGSVSIFDPVFIDSEKEWLGENGFCVLDVNDECLRRATRPTIFYMPHCGRPMYNNLLYSNWNAAVMPNVVIVGNSFTMLRDNLVCDDDRRDFKYLNACPGIFEEIKFPRFAEASEAFNDLSLHFCTIDKAEKFKFANYGQPVYSSECEIIRA